VKRFEEMKKAKSEDSFGTDEDFVDLDEELLNNQSVPMLKTLQEKGVENVLDINLGKTVEDMDYDHYSFAVGGKYDLKTRNLTWKKVKYIWDEQMNDIRWSKRASVEFQLAVFYICFLFFLRMFTHYIGQYFVCTAMNVPVTQFDTHWYKIYITYASFKFMHEFFVVLAGVAMNTFLFLSLIAIKFAMKNTFGCFPRVYYKVLSWVGVFIVLDPILVLLIDLASGSWQQGDWFKFYTYFMKKEGNGIVGIYITFFIMFGMTIFNGFLYYYYMIFVHMEGRILDLYKRMSGTRKTFFVPHDNEVSLKYLQWVMNRVMTSQK
jgi:hypothetical protein